MLHYSVNQNYDKDFGSLAFFKNHVYNMKATGFIPTEDFLMEGTLVSSNNLTSKKVSYPVPSHR